MLLRKRKPKPKPDYKFDVGAYSQSPRAREVENGQWNSIGYIESWRGSVEDLCRVGEAALAALGDRADAAPTVQASMTDRNGLAHAYTSMEDLAENAVQISPHQIYALRIEISEPDVKATVVARDDMPGVLVSVSGNDQLRVDALARLIFARAMRGYVDRYAGFWRPTAAVVTTLVPAGVAYGLGTRLAETWPTWVVALYAFAAIAGVFLIMIHSWQWTLVKAPLELVPDATPPRASRWARVRGIRNHKRVSATLALIGVIVVSIVANKLSDLIPWP